MKSPPDDPKPAPNPVLLPPTGEGQTSSTTTNNLASLADHLPRPVVLDTNLPESTSLNDDSEPLGRRPRKIALINQKGGVGKTTTTANLGAALADAGQRVLLIDLDPQAHLTLHFGLDPNTLEHSTYDLLTDPQISAADVAHQVGDNLAILPAEVNLAGAESELAPLAAAGRAQQILARKCRPLVGDNQWFDIVLIDCPPSLGLLTVSALATATEVIVPMQSHFLALQGLSELLKTVQMVGQAINPTLIVSGIILCMHESHTILATEVANDLKQFLEQARTAGLPWSGAQVLDPPIRRNVKLAEAPSFGSTIFDYAPKSLGAADYRTLARSVLKLDESYTVTPS